MLFIQKKLKNLVKKSTFYIVGRHAVIEALKNPLRRVIRVFLTEESKKQIHKESPNTNILKNVTICLHNQILFLSSCSLEEELKLKPTNASNKNLLLSLLN